MRKRFKKKEVTIVEAKFELLTLISPNSINFASY